MDEVLIQALRGSFSPEQSQREEAEAFLTKAEQSPGYITALIRIWVNPALDVQIRQSSSIQAKNVIRKHWSRSMNYDGTVVDGTPGVPGSYEVSEEEKTFVKEHMIEVLVHCTEQPNLRGQALECVKLVVNREYPIRWPGFLNQCLALVSSGEETKAYCGLACLRVIAREFEMKSSGKAREPLEELIQVAMPGLLSLGERLVSSAGQVAAATLLKFILKIYYSCVQIRLSRVLADAAVCTRWFELCSKAVMISPADGSSGADLEEGPHAKVHKWGFRILSRFFAKYGNPEIADSENDDSGFDATKFAEWWLGSFAPPLVSMVSDLLATRSLSRPAKYQALSFVSEGIAHSVTYRAMKPKLQSLLFEVIFPLMCFSKEDGELWESDSEEFVRREFDCMVSFSDPRTAATEFLKNMVSLRSKDSLAPLLKFCESHLFTEPPAYADIAKCSRKDGALAIIGAIAPQLCVSSKKAKKSSKKSIASSSAASRLPDKSQLEAILAQFVLPDFGCPVKFLRYRACWVYQQFAEENFAFQNPTTTQMAFAGFRKCLSDPDLPVRVQAGTSVKSFIAHEDFEPMIKPAVPELLDKLLKLMHEVDCEPLASTLETLVTEFSQEVLPFASQAVEQLGKVFVRLMDADEADDEAQMACMGSIQTICTIMEGASARPALFVPLETACYPILDKIFTPNGLDYMEDALDMLTYLTFYTPEPLTLGLWKYFDLMHQSVCGGQLPGGFALSGSLAEGWAVDYTENMLNVMDNYISRGTSRFLSGNGFCGRSYLQMLFEIVAKALANDSEITQLSGAKIAACIFESCPRGSVGEDWVKAFVQLGWSKFSADESSGLNRWLFYLFTMALYYDPGAILRVVEGLGISKDFFTAFAKLSKFAKSKDERKALCLALCGLLKLMATLSSQQHTSSVACFAKDYVEILAVQTKEIANLRRKAREAAAQQSEEDEDEEDDEDEDGEIDLQDLDEGQSADQSAKARFTNRIKAEIALIREQYAAVGGDDDGDEDEDDEDYEDSDDEDCERVSPLDPLSEFSAIKDLLTGMDATALLSWFSKSDLVDWNALLDANILADEQDKLNKSSE